MVVGKFVWPPEPGKKGLGAFYEIESLSPALALAPGETLTHHHRTLHVQADSATLADEDWRAGTGEIDRTDNPVDDLLQIDL